MPRPHRTYTDEDKARAIGQAVVGTNTGTAAALGIPKPTLIDWMKDERYEGLRQVARDTVAEQLWVGIQVGLHAVVEGFSDPKANLRDKATALGIIYDKHALLTGGATNRSESRDISGTLSDAELIAAIREADRIAGGDRTEETSPDAPAD